MNWMNNLAQEMKISLEQINKTIELINDDKTIPFIARYRKECTGSLDEIQIRNIFEALSYQNKLAERKQEIIQSLTNSEQITPELSKQVNIATSLKELEDLYLPYKKKQKTKADVAVEKGLKPLAEFIRTSKQRNDKEFQKYISKEKGVYTVEEALEGALDIIAEEFSYDLKIREILRENILRHGRIHTKRNEKVADDKQIYKSYYDASWSVYNLPEWRVLAINRAEKEKVIKTKMTLEWERFDQFLLRKTGTDGVDGLNMYLLSSIQIKDFHAYFPELFEGMSDSYKRLLFPSIEREIRSDLTERAEKRSVEIFQKNLRHMMLTPPLKKCAIAGVDPGFRTGCKVAVIDENGQFMSYQNIFPNPPQNSKSQSTDLLNKLYAKNPFELIAIGNGTASHETEEFIIEWIEQIPEAKIKYVIVSEAGASVYSASSTAGDEFPHLDLTIRGAISIGRRIQDMLNELVKIPPESIGVGMYQHDISPTILKEKLALEVESVVNYVGVDLNQASEYLLQYVSGFNKKIAKNVVEYRTQNKGFKTRAELKKVKGVGDKTYELAAGFCRVPESANPLDHTIIHPESYAIAEKLISFFGLKTRNVLEYRDTLKEKVTGLNISQLAVNLQESEILIKDIIDSLVYRRLDPREEYPQPILKDSIKKFDELHLGYIAQGVIRNVTDFGIFVDIGVGRDALIYRSSFENFNPDEYYPGMIIQTEIITLDSINEKIGLKKR